MFRVRRERLGDGLDDRGGDEHAGLDRIGADVVEDDADLVADGLGRNGVEGVDAGRVLHGDGGDRRHGVGAERGRGLDVGLDAGAAARIRTGDDEDAGGVTRRRHG